MLESESECQTLQPFEAGLFMEEESLVFVLQMLGCLKPDKSEASQWIRLGTDQDNPPTNKCFDWELLVHDPKSLQSTHPGYLDPKTLQSLHPDYGENICAFCVSKLFTWIAVTTLASSVS